MYPIPTVEELSTFSGRPLPTYGAFASEALVQGTLYFMIVTELQTPPNDPTEALLAKKGILAFSDHLYLIQPYQAVEAAPFQTERIGSYTYSKPLNIIRGTAQANALKGETTGIMWFDMAVSQLALRTQRGGVYSSDIVLMEREYDEAIVALENGQACILGPAERNKYSNPYFINGEQYGMDAAADRGTNGPGGGPRW